MNYGHAITIAFVLFMLFILSMVFKAFTLNFDLVSENYYDKEIRYQEQIEKTKNSRALAKDISWLLKDEGIEIRFPEKENFAISGTLQLMRPSDKSKDIITPISLNKNNVQLIEASKLMTGKYLLQIEWQQGETSYFYESIIVI